MMRSLYSGVAGLRTHQTKMDVIGNNIANVNTVGFKASMVNFSDTFYQTVSSATGPNASTGSAGTNAKQIGLGSMVASITTNITEQGGTSSTNRALDIAINGEAFLVVKSGGATYFSKSGALNVDSQGTLYSTTNGATIQGWLADANGDIVKDIAQDLKVMSPENLYYEPESTENVTLSGNIDKMDKNLAVDAPKTLTTNDGFPVTFSFYDNLGQLYTAKMYVYATGSDATAGTTNYAVTLGDIYNEDGESIFVEETVDEKTGETKYVARPTKVTLGGVVYEAGTVGAQTGKLTLKGDKTNSSDAASLKFNTKSGEFVSVGNDGLADTSIYKSKGVILSIATTGGTGTGTAIDNTFMQYDSKTDEGGVVVDFSGITQYSSAGVSNVTYKKGDNDGYGTGNIAGEMKGISIDDNGYVYGTYNNGAKRCLAQIAVATFANPSGLEAVGDSMFAQTLNSGDFDGVGEEISLSGSFTVGALEMSNVDLASEFTSMITTQRGFQANSRIITTSDSMLEELVNLKR